MPSRYGNFTMFSLCILLADSYEKWQDCLSHEIRGGFLLPFLRSDMPQLLNRIAFFMQGSVVSPFHPVSFPLQQQEWKNCNSVEWLASASRINDKNLASKLPLALDLLRRFKWPCLFTKNVFNTVVYEHLVHTITWSKKGKLWDPKVWCACVMTQQSRLVGLN